VLDWASHTDPVADRLPGMGAAAAGRPGWRAMTRYKAFISYKHAASTRFAENLELALKAYAKPIYRPPMAAFLPSLPQD
jgi:hypothetical protein